MLEISTDVLVIGGGPAGLIAAIYAVECGKRVVVLEKNDQPGKKLLITGGGHCNITNTEPIERWPAQFGKYGRFITPALNALSQEKLRAWLASLGIITVVMNESHIYPRSRSARQIRDVLVAKAENLGVRFHLNTPAEEITVVNNSASGVLSKNISFLSKKVIIASGGLSYPSVGADGSGLAMAKKTGHRLVDPVPGLVGLDVLGWPSWLAGLVLPNAKATFKARDMQAEQKQGELLLTHTGVSGPAILNLSASVNQVLAQRATSGLKAIIQIECIAGHGEKEWQDRFTEWRKGDGEQTVYNLLREHFPARFAEWQCTLAGVGTNMRISALPSKCRGILIENLTNLKLTVNRGGDWKKAMITRGGVDLRDINPTTLESKIISGLYFAGEVLDIDGPCGGYNLQWAFSSGALAGEKAAMAGVRP